MLTLPDQAPAHFATRRRRRPDGSAANGRGDPAARRGEGTSPLPVGNGADAGGDRAGGRGDPRRFERAAPRKRRERGTSRQRGAPAHQRGAGPLPRRRAAPWRRSGPIPRRWSGALAELHHGRARLPGAAERARSIRCTQLATRGGRPSSRAPNYRIHRSSALFLLGALACALLTPARAGSPSTTSPRARPARGPPRHRARRALGCVPGQRARSGSRWSSGSLGSKAASAPHRHAAREHPPRAAIHPLWRAASPSAVAEPAAPRLKPPP